MTENNDPIILYLIIRSSLNMSVGKTAVQAAHGTQYIYEKFLKMQMFTAQSNLFYDWNESLHRKIVLKADDKEFEKIKAELPKEDYAVVVDMGLTELSPNTETCIAIFPNYKSKCHKLVKKLQLL
jgi:peptidyl-tRNA hydrolase